jgi:hypothetical protein
MQWCADIEARCEWVLESLVVPSATSRVRVFARLAADEKKRRGPRHRFGIAWFEYPGQVVHAAELRDLILMERDVLDLIRVLRQWEQALGARIKLVHSHLEPYFVMQDNLRVKIDVLSSALMSFSRWQDCEAALRAYVRAREGLEPDEITRPQSLRRVQRVQSIKGELVDEGYYKQGTEVSVIKQLLPIKLHVDPRVTTLSGLFVGYLKEEVFGQCASLESAEGSGNWHDGVYHVLFLVWTLMKVCLRMQTVEGNKMADALCLCFQKLWSNQAQPALALADVKELVERIGARGSARAGGKCVGGMFSPTKPETGEVAFFSKKHELYLVATNADRTAFTTARQEDLLPATADS